MRFIQQALAGFGSAVAALLYGAAVVATVWGASYIRDRAEDPVRAARVLLAAVVGIALIASVLFFPGQRVTWFMFLLIFFGVPTAVGLAPRGFWRDLFRPDAPSGGERMGSQLGDRLR